MSHQTFFDAIHEAKLRRVAPPAWSWRATESPATLDLYEHGEHVATINIRPGHIERRAALADAITAHLNST